MPIYEYLCHNCGDQVEVLVLSTASAPCCPNCGSELRDRLISAAHVIRGLPGHSRGETCCGREDRCDAPPCSEGGACRR